MDLSIVVPLLNEHESLPVLAERLHKVMGAMGVKYEILFIDDGSTDPSWSVVRKLSAADPRVSNIEIAAPTLDDLYAHFLRAQEVAA